MEGAHYKMTNAKGDLKNAMKPKTLAFSGLLTLVGWLFPPIAVALRFGFGTDFFINLLLTICGYFPGHFHNFYVQNIRNNKNKKRTPKWVRKAGIVDDSVIKKHELRSQWANRYNDRLPNSTLEGQPLEEGEVAGRSDRGTEDNAQANGDRYWKPDDERYYNANGSRHSVESGGSGGKRWHYPANFDDVVDVDYGLGASGSNDGAASVSSKKKKSKKDRWARTEDAYSASADGGSQRKKKKKSRKGKSTVGDGDMYNENRGPYDDPDRRSDTTGASGNDVDFPEDPAGGNYGKKRGEANGHALPPVPSQSTQQRRDGDDNLNHEF